MDIDIEQLLRDYFRNSDSEIKKGTELVFYHARISEISEDKSLNKRESSKKNKRRYLCITGKNPLYILT